MSGHEDVFRQITVLRTEEDVANGRWRQLVAGLLADGVAEAVIARETGLSRTTVRRVAGKPN